jgi:hypothetical protein
MLFGVWSLLQPEAQEQVERPLTAAAPPELNPAARQALERHVAQLQERVDRLVLVVHAMWSLIAEKTNLTEADLLQRMNDLDAADGVVDGRVTRPPIRCSCGAMVNRKLHRCLFCGKEAPDAGTFDKL